MRKAKLGLGLFLLVCGVVGDERHTEAANWPRFRGPNGTGIAMDTDIPVQWSAKDGILWKTAVPGAGNSSPVIWGDRIFLQSASADGKERLLLCLSTSDGKVLWSRTHSGDRAKINAKNTLASSTPATDGERVVAAFWDGKEITLAAYDLKGEPLWQRNLGGFRSQHGAGASPVLYKDKVFYALDQDGAATLYALDAKTGKTAWQKTRKPFRACYSAPFLLTRGDKTELMVESTGGVTAYDPDSGAENWTWNWKFTGKPLRTVGSPVYSEGLIFVPAGDGDGERHYACFKVGDKGDVTKTNLAWETKKRSFPYVPCALIRGEHLYFVNDQGFAECHVAKTGDTVWAERLGGNVTASPVLIDGKIYSISEDGDVFVFPAEPTYKLLAKNSLGETVRASPAVADHRLYIRGQNHLFCIGKPAAK